MSRLEELTGLREFKAEDFRFDERHHVAGSGGLGDVVYGYHIGLNTEVAIKFNKFAHGAIDMNAVHEEIKHQKQVNHENIVQILGWVKMDSAIGIVMEYCNLGSLKTLLLDKRIEIGLPLQVQLILYIAKALACCHNLQGKRLIHVDVKPENILLAGFLVIKLCDFGSSEMSTWTELLTADHSTRSKKNRPQYTPYYTAPEKLKDLAMKPRKELDVYALGMIIYMFLTREMPYPRCNEEEWKALCDAIKKGLRPNCEAILDWKQTLNDNDKEIAEALEVLMKECWHQDPSSRPTMMTICDRLQGILNQQRTSAIMFQAAEVVKQMEELYPPPINLNQCLTLGQLWQKRHGLQDSVPNRSSTDRPTTSHNTSGSCAVTTNRTQSTSEHTESTETASTKDSSADPSNITQRQSTSAVTRGWQTTTRQETGEKVDPTSLIEKYVELVKEQKYLEANETKIQISRSFQSLEASAEDLGTTGNEHKDERKYLESILFYDLASDLFAKRNIIKGAVSVAGCALGLNKASEGLLETKDLFLKLQNKQIVRNHVIPLMQKMRIKIKKMRNVEGGAACLQEIRCLHYIGCIEHLIGDLESTEETIKLGLEIMEKQFGDDAGKYQAYGTLLNNLGWVYAETNRLKESEDFYGRAISSYEMATDFTEEERKEIENSKDNLRRVQTMLRQ